MDSAATAEDDRRLDQLRTLGLLSSEADPALDRLSRIAAAVTGSEIAMITFMAGDRQFIRSRVGTAAEEAPMRESFCICVLERGALVEIADATRDPRFAANRFVCGPRAIRSYAGVPVLFDGLVLGTLCVLDSRVRVLADDQRAILRDLAGMVEGLLQSRHEQVLLVQERQRAVELAAALGESEKMLDDSRGLARSMAEKAARESAERDRLLWQTATDVVMMIDENEVIRFCNPAILRVLGYRPDEVVGRPLSVLQPERLRPGHRAGFDRYVATGVRHLDWRAVEIAALHRDGREVPVEISFSDMQIDGRRIFGAFMRDITQRMEHRQALQRSEERYRRIVQTAEEGIWMIDAQAGTTFVNPKMASMLGYTVDEMMGRSLYDFMDEQARAQARENAWRRSQGISEQHDFRLSRKDGSDLWTAMSTSAAFDDAGRYAGALAMVTDITERRRAEEALRQLEGQLREAQKMEAIGVLAGGIAHDFNNVLAGILGNTALAIQDLPPGHPAAASLDQIRKAGLRGRGLVQQILAFARRQPREVASCELRPLLEECIGLLRSTLPAGVTLDAALTAEPLFVMADATQVEQVLMNLCTNAWHALGGKPGRVAVALDAVDLDVAAARHLGAGLTPGAYARLRVEDNGRGMDADTRERIFEPFFTTKAVGEGTGLGLAVAHGIVAAHGGVIRVQTALGEGSAFEIYLPRSASGSAVERPQPPAIAHHGHGESVLYIDDDEVMVVMVERLLERLGYVVTSVHDPARAIEMVRAAPEAFDVVVTDLNMPELSGLDVARALQRIRADLPLVISSGNLPDQLHGEARQAGVRALVHKQFTLEELGAVIHWVLVGGQRLGMEPLQMSLR